MDLNRSIKIIALALCVAFAAPALAQKATKAPANYTESHLNAALELIKITQLDKSFSIVVPQLGIRILNNVTRTRPELRKDLDAVLDKLVPEFEKENQGLIEKTAREFAAVMSETEIKETLTFFKSKVGKKYLASQPKVIEKMVITLDEWNRDLSQRMLESVRAEMKKKGHDI